MNNLSAFEDSHMDAPIGSQFNARKIPVQSRSETTVRAIHEAAIQVLTAHGYGEFTTTRVADRAGVSVGTLYQYYPDKRALLAALIASHLNEVLAAVRKACLINKGERLRVMLEGVIDALIDVKFARRDASLALYTPMSEVDGLRMVQKANEQGAHALSEMLATASDASVPAPEIAGRVVAAALSALLQAGLRDGNTEQDRNALRYQLLAVTLGYLTFLAWDREGAHTA
jgi:AcrR family transcriptional regulator